MVGDVAYAVGGLVSVPEVPRHVGSADEKKPRRSGAELIRVWILIN